MTYFGVETTIETEDGTKTQIEYFDTLEVLLEANPSAQMIYVCDENNVCKVLRLDEYTNDKNA